MKHVISIIIFLSIYKSALAEIRINPTTKLVEGDVCVQSLPEPDQKRAWSFIPFHPVGAACVVQLKNNNTAAGSVINQTPAQQDRLKEIKLKREKQSHVDTHIEGSADVK